MAECAVNFPNIPGDVLQDLCSRFLINIPENEKNDMVRICFQIEQAHWYYIDFYRQEDPDLPPCGMKAFIQIIFTKFEFLNKTRQSVQTIYDNWRKYKVRVPVYGAILLDESLEKCLLVQGFHNKASWGFPKGKVNKDEEGIDCAIREVFEEVGYDIKPLAQSFQYLENNFHDHQVCLYIVPGVFTEFDFKPNTRGEIKEIKWFYVNHLPTHKRDPKPKDELGLSPNNFFMVQPFVKPLRKWISEQIDKMSSMNSVSTILSHQNTARQFKLKESRKQLFSEKKNKDEQLINLYQNNKENELKAMLGLKAPSPSQPEAIRKLLSGTVQTSPKTTSDRQQKKSERFPFQKQYSTSVGSKNTATLDFGRKTSDHNTYSLFPHQRFGGNSPSEELHHSQPQFVVLQRDAEKSAFRSTVPSLHNKQSQQQYIIQQRPSYIERNSPNARLITDSPKHGKSKNQIKILAKHAPLFSDFSYSSPAFTSFKFDYMKIMSNL